jgi:signal transduction histidine kinase/ActR/RegA family two-component response regulator
MTTEMRKTGVDVVGDMPWGTHCCLFYETKADVLDILVSYFKAGLESREFCLWVVPEPLMPEEASRALRRAVPEFDRYLADCSIEIVAARDWYLQDGKFDLKRVIGGWNEKLARASARGYAGIRVTGDTAWLERHDWKDFCEYEDSLNQSIAHQRMAVLCTYPLAACGAAEILDVVRTHQFAVAKRRGSWEVIETAGHKQAKAEIKRVNDELEQRVVERTSQLTTVNEELTKEVLERQRAEDALQRSEAYLAEAQRLSHAGSFGWIPSSGELVWSGETYRIFDYDPAIEPTMEMAIQRVHPEDRSLVRQIIDRASEAGHDWNLDHRLWMPDGSVKHLHVVAHAVKDESRGAVSFVGAVMDITERKLAETRLRQAENMEALGRLAGGIAHDFNNILGGILGYGEMLVEETPAGSGLKRYAQNVLTGANRARELVDQILVYSRSQRNKQVALDLGRLVAETLELMRGSLGEGVHLEMHLPSRPAPVIGDATQLHQVVMNLCMNALQAMEGTGRLTVTLAETDLETERTFRHGTLAPGRHVVLTIEDSGRGMDEATLGHIFEPFFTTKAVGKGTGLGLAMVFGIVTGAGGAIDVTSELGRGSAFTLYFPRADASIEADRGESPAPRGHGECVLVIEDEEALLAVTSEVLARLGYSPCAFSDSRAALAEFESSPGRFGAVIADELMPGFTGTQLAEQVRRRRADLPVVLVSGYVGPAMAQRAAAAGVTEILKKPVRSQELAAALARAFEKTKEPITTATH